jgi:VWFA-related protein
MKTKIARAPVWMLAAALLSLAPLRSQEPPAAADENSAPQGQFFEAIDVNLVNVDVYVTDKQGNRVHGLTKDDFQIFEDGRPVAVSNFYAVDDGKPVAGSEGEAAAPAAPAPPALAPAQEVPEDQRLHLVVYVDNWNIRPFDRNRVFVGIRDFLRTQLAPGDRVMLETYDREPHVRRPFTSDADSIAAALFEIEKISAHGAELESDRREVLQRIQDSQDFSSAYSFARAYAQSLHNDLSFSVSSLRDLVDSLAGLPGRKAILYVSDGLELTPGEDVYHALQEKYTSQTSVLLETNEFNLTRSFEELVAAANSDRISFYTLDAGGLRISTNASAQVSSRNAGNLVDATYWGNLQGSIQMIAERTGGIAILNTNDPTARLQRIGQDFKSYYSLAYAPAHASDGRYHSIEVKTKRKGLELRYRDGYRDKSIESRMSDGVIAALTYEVEDNPLGVVLDHGEGQPHEGGHYLVPISVRIPIGKLVLVQQGDKRVARARLFFAAMDDKGGVSDVQQAVVPIAIPADQVERASQQYWRYDVSMIMRGGEQRLAVGLRDELGQVSSFAVRAFQVGN